jgi:cytochrome c-type biogenesis protein CcmH
VIAWRVARIVATVMLLVVPATRAQSTVAPPQLPTMSDSALDARVRAIAEKVRCPVCQGESIQASPAELAQQMRAVVREQLLAGKSEAEIKAYFVSRYGEWILLEPAMTGLNVLLYVFPIVLVIGGLAFVVTIVRRWSATTIATTEADNG